MKHFYLKSLLAGLLLFAASNSFAYDFEEDGIYYNILSEEEKTVEVTYQNSTLFQYQSSYAGEVVIPEEVVYGEKQYSVVSIGQNAFNSCKELTSVYIPNSVKTIGRESFSLCSNLISINIPQFVSIIEVFTFAYCSSLTSIIIPDNVTIIKNSAFTHCTSLTSVSIPNSVTTIEGGAFSGCFSLNSIYIPNSVTTIGGDAFSECFSLASVTLSNSIKTIKARTFAACTSLSSITIPSSVTSIEDSAFDCCGLTSLLIPNSVTTIGKRTFSGCNSITSLELGNSLISIGDDAFNDCSKLKNVNIPNSVTYIGKGAFENCNSLNSITLSNSNDTIMDYTFFYCEELTSITIPQNIKGIKNYAFSGCSGLLTVISDIEVPFEISETTFQNYKDDEYVFTDATLYVPVGTKELYESTPGWNLFKNIVEMGLTPVEEDNGEKDFGADAGIDEETKMDGNIVNDIFYNILEDNGFYNREEGCIVIKKETVDEFLDYIENKNLFSDEVKQQFTGLALMLKANCQWLKITAEASGNMTLKVKIGNMPPMEMALDGKKTVELPCSLSEPAMAYIYGSLLPHAGAKGMRRAKAGETVDELKIYSIAWSEEQEASGIRHTEQQDSTAQPAVYNLQGQRVIPSRQGFYIVNGKKLFVK